MLSDLQKTNRLLQLILGAFLLIAFRIWHLAVIQREEKLQEQQKPKLRTIVERADRGSIVDRFGIPLAVNRICYNASVYYSQCAQIPAVSWHIDEAGERKKIFPRKEHIAALAKLLGEQLEMDAERIEDLIHAKASLLPHVPFIIRSHISEEAYYRLKALEKDWAGLHAEVSSERFYPMGKTASHLLGYLGSISQTEYLAIADELRELQEQILEGNEEETTLIRYRELKEKAYTLNDFVGKTGLEKQYESELRGFYGKRRFEVDRNGRSLFELEGGQASIPGQTIALTISSELQQFCEGLLIQDEKARDGRSIGIDYQTKLRKGLKQPWIKGGAIVALDPNTGEVLALAGEPRFDPNDFILTSHREEKLPRLRRWQESERLIADVWDGKEPLFREKGSQEELAFLSWDMYLQWILPSDGPLRALWNRVDDLKTAIQLQEDFEALLYFSNLPPSQLIELLFSETRPALPAEAQPHRRRLETALSSIPQSVDKLFALDLCRLAAYSAAFPDELIAKIGSTKLSLYRTQTQALRRIEAVVYARAKKIFHQTTFRLWRTLHQKEYLSQKRQEEKEKKLAARPYLDYLDRKEEEEFKVLWNTLRYPLLSSLLLKNPALLTEDTSAYFDPALFELDDWTPLRTASTALSGEECIQWLKSMRSFTELDRPLWSDRAGKKQERDLAMAYYPKGGFGFTRSQALQCAAPLGSLFKLVVAAEALSQKGPPISHFSLFDEVHIDKNRTIVGYTADRQPLYRNYKGGRLPRSHLPHLGKVDLIGALEQSSNPYFAILAGDHLEDPDSLTKAAHLFGFGERSGIDLPNELKGHLPTDLKSNRTGLYSFAIGQHTLVATPLQAALMLAALANGGQLFSPRLALNQSPAIRRNVPLSPPMRNTLFEGMHRVVWGSKGSARPSAIRSLMGHPLLLRDFLTLQHQIIGKTSTAEILCRLDANPSASMQMYKHIWFGTIAFRPSDSLKVHQARWDDPELVVVVYLRYGDGGKEAAPLAAQVIRKWREIRDRSSNSLLSHIKEK